MATVLLVSIVTGIDVPVFLLSSLMLLNNTHQPDIFLLLDSILLMIAHVLCCCRLTTDGVPICMTVFTHLTTSCALLMDRVSSLQDTL